MGATTYRITPERSAFQWSEPNPVNFVDEAIFARLLRIRINPAGLCDDTTFLRRAYLDLTGLLPTQEQAQQFLMSTSHDKRKLLIDSLLETPEFSDFQRYAGLIYFESKTRRLTRKESKSFTTGLGRVLLSTNLSTSSLQN
jgi:hypothetical protein